MRYARGSQNQDLHGRLRTIAADRKVIQDMRSVNIHEIGSNTREHKDFTDMKFEADDGATLA